MKGFFFVAVNEDGCKIGWRYIHCIRRTKENFGEHPTAHGQNFPDDRMFLKNKFCI